MCWVTPLVGLDMAAATIHFSLRVETRRNTGQNELSTDALQDHSETRE